MIQDGLLTGIDHKKACKNFVKAGSKGVVKVMSKMGISDHPELPRRAGLRGRRPPTSLSSTTTSPGRPHASAASASMSSPQEVLARHRAAYPDRHGQRPRVSHPAANTSGATTAKPTSSTPESIHRLQKAVRTVELRRLQRLLEDRQRSGREALHPALAARVQGRLDAGADRGSRVRSRRS